MLIRARVKFEKIKDDMFLKNHYEAYDMHVHTTYSDGRINTASLVKKAERLGIGLAITDHNEIKGAIEICQRKEVKTIPGIELTSNEGVHLLAYFYDIQTLTDYYNNDVLPYKRKRGIFLKKGILQILDDLKKYECLKVAAHPYAVSWTGICKQFHSKIINPQLIRSLDAIEVMNGEAGRNANLKALSLAESLNMPITGGSDAHNIIQFGQIVTYTKKEKENFLDSIKKAKTHTIGLEYKKIPLVLNQTTKTKSVGLTHLKRSLSYIKSKIKK